MAGRQGGANGAIQVIGHRGAAGLVPENTLASFERALSLGVDAVECDVHLTRDGHAVILHNDQVARTTNGAGRVLDLDLASLMRLDAGDGQRMPLLEQLLDLVAGRCHLLCEVKADGMEEQVADMIRGRGMQAEVTVISFRLDRLSRVRRRGEVRTGALIAAPTIQEIDHALGLGVSYVGVHDRYATARVFQRIRQAGRAAGVWTPNTLEGMKAMIEMGATHITTDRPDILLGYLGR